MDTKTEVSLYRPQGETYAAMVIVHGMQEHHQRYAQTARFLSEHGIAVLTFDLPGHGRCAAENEDLGWFAKENGWDVLTGSAVDMIRYMKKEYPNIPLWLMGHSMGSMIARCCLQEREDLIDGVILTGTPYYDTAASFAKVLTNLIAFFKGKRGHSKLLDRLMTGKFNDHIFDPRTALDWLSYNEDNVNTYILDPLCGVPFTIQGYHDLVCGMCRMHDVKRYHCTKVHMPILIMNGKDDPCAGNDKQRHDTVQVLQDAGYQNVEMKTWGHMRHEILNEEDAQLVLDTIVYEIGGAKGNNCVS